MPHKYSMLKAHGFTPFGEYETELNNNDKINMYEAINFVVFQQWCCNKRKKDNNNHNWAKNIKNVRANLESILRLVAHQFGNEEKKRMSMLI